MTALMIRVSTLAKRWDLDERTIRRYIEDKKIEYMVLPGGDYRILLSSVEAYEDQKK